MVGDQHAGKTGACPKCKGPITIPTKADEVIIHAPELEAGAKDAKGRSVLKPLRRKEAKFSLTTTAIIVGVVLLVIAVAWLVGRTEMTDANRFVALAFGAALLGPPLAYAGYSFLRDDELGYYQGKDVLLRSLACGLAYALLWGVYWWVGTQFFGNEAYAAGLEMVQLAMLAVPIMALGAGTAFVSFDLEPITGFFHYALYFVVCIGLRFVMSLPLLPGMSG
jgi:hypothetical protein